ncbi:hypothetical protein E3P94_03046 [Wallemia ichthyophaga]|nr:hypothetical protein E3P95_03086 [Wallemia ichthyophaga]TIA98198.1 hypothetical protein E3P94_03046 [Wallemia ichthyophaga]
MSKSLQDLDVLSHVLKQRLLKADLIDPFEVLVMDTGNLSKRLNMSASECQKLIDVVALGAFPDVEDWTSRFNSMDSFTSGDSAIDDVLGGGIREQSLLEIVGASSVGKSQLTMQSLVTVQLPFEEGGLDARAILIHASKAPPTERLSTIARTYFPGSHPNDILSNISLLHVRDFQCLQHALDFFIPRFLVDGTKSKPVRLIAVDSLGELSRQFDSNAHGLAQRNASLLRVVDSCKRLIHKYRLSLVVVNGVSEAIQENQIATMNSYGVQSRAFSGQSVHSTKQAQLGLIWAHNVQTRLMLVRTLRKVHVKVTESEIRMSSTANGEAEARLPMPPKVEESVMNIDRRFKKPRKDETFAVHKRRAHVVYSTYLSGGKCEFYILPIGVRSVEMTRPDRRKGSPVPTCALTPAISQSHTQSIDDDEAKIWASISFSDGDEEDL